MNMKNEKITHWCLFALSLFGLLVEQPVNAQPFGWQWATQTVQAFPPVAIAGRSVIRASVVDAAGNVYVAGSMIHGTTFGGTSFSSTTFYDGFVGKINAIGQWEWVIRPTTIRRRLDWVESLALDGDSCLYVAGDFDTTATFGTTTLRGRGRIAGFVARVTTRGQWRWARIIDGDGNVGVTQIVTNSRGEAFVTGSYKSTLILDSLSITRPSVPNIRYNFVAKISPSGHWRWLLSDAGSFVAPDALGGAYVAGWFDGTLIAGRDTLVSVGQSDGLIGQIDAAGQWQWAQRVGGVEFDGLSGIQLAAASRTLYVSGTYLTTTNVEVVG
jgi:hypothetical protein